MAAHAELFARRRAGVLAHITSLPGPGASGTLGGEAREFVRFLREAGFSVWQMLPVGPVNASGSPYQSSSTFAGNPLMLPPDATHAGGDYPGFRRQQAYWLDDYALYCALKARFGGEPWYRWPAPLRDREPAALAAARGELAAEMDAECRTQHAFFSAWMDLKTYANNAGIYLFGDLPMFAAHDSADVWSRREFFCVDPLGLAEETAGVPPDAFSARGQHWGYPQYRWRALAADGFRWWIERLKVQSSLFDLLRVDHFRGFEASWHIPAGAATAAEGRWVEVPGHELFAAVEHALGPLPLVAEDLGYITPSVEALRRELNLPGMHVLQFAFEGDTGNPHLPHNHRPEGVVYTGTHDNNTTLGWWQALEENQRQRVREYLDFPEEPMPWPLIHTALASVCRLAVLPLQDCLGLDARARMNVPGEEHGNWRWRCEPGVLDQDLADRLLALLKLYGRSS